MAEAECRLLPSVLAPGQHFLQGDEACAEGAIAAGCDFYAGYPITPATEIMEHIVRRFGELTRRVFLQMEDELASIGAAIGASWAGAKAMTATSGPGFSLMLENLGYAIMTETPLVVVDVQRAGPSTGQATRPSQADVMQARWGAGGDYELIVLAPWSVAEMYGETVRAFNLAERFRMPVIVLADEAIGHLRERLDVPAQTLVCKRRKEPGAAPWGGALVPPMAAFGDGEKLLVTGSTHDARGLRRTSDPDAQAAIVERLVSKVADNRQEIVRTEMRLAGEGDMELLFVAYGSSARSAHSAARMLRAEGLRVGLLRLCTLWPFADEALQAMAKRVHRVLVVEMNRGQALREVQRVVPEARGYHKTNGETIAPDELASAAKEWMG